MNKLSKLSLVITVAALLVAVAILGLGFRPSEAAATPKEQAPVYVPDFIRVGETYQFSNGDNYIAYGKVLEIRDDGWMVVENPSMDTSNYVAIGSITVVWPRP